MIVLEVTKYIIFMGIYVWNIELFSCNKRCTIGWYIVYSNITFIIQRAWAAPQHINQSYAYANNKGADQPAHPCSLISTFAVHFLDSLIPILNKFKTPLASVADQASLSPICSEPPKTDFLVTWLSLCPLSLTYLSTVPSCPWPSTICKGGGGVAWLQMSGALLLHLQFCWHTAQTETLWASLYYSVNF